MKCISTCLLVLLLAGCAASGSNKLDVQKNHSKLQESARLHTELAGLYFQRTQMGIALSEVDAALAAERNYAPAYSMRGLIHMALHEDKDAEEDFQQSLRLDGSDSETQNNYGWFLCQRGKERESIPHFMAAVKDPLYVTPERAYLNAGLCTQKAGDNRAAEEFLQRALSLQPDLMQALRGMAELRFAAGDYPNAQKYFARYAQKTDSLTAGELLLAVRIERRLGDRNAEASYALELSRRYPDARETQLLRSGE